jgi:adenylate kinase family enzyme
VRRVVILGRGASGKSALAKALGRQTGLPVTELDRVFWQPGLLALSSAQWAAAQQELTGADSWILDGDLGPYDVPGVRLREADTVIVLDFPLWRCAWRAARRSRERVDFWRWMVGWRRRSRPVVLTAVFAEASGADVFVLRNPRAITRFLAATSGSRPPIPTIPESRRRRQ